MIRVNIKRNNKKEVLEFSVMGHANADEHGKDIVCAAVSVLSQTIILGLYEVLKIKVPYKIRDGYLKCTIPQHVSMEDRKKINLLLETMIVGMRSIKESYGKYIDIHDEEV